MKKTIDRRDFYEAFEDLRPDNFSPGALGELFEYYEEFDPDFELDVIAICCDWTEYDEDEFINEFGSEDEDILTILNRVERNHTVLSVASGTSFLVSN